jgi:hypothetical protein
MKNKSKSNLKHSASGENSSNISFNGDANQQEEHHPPLSRKSTYMNGIDTSKNYGHYERNNVFKQERMSVSRVLNN